MADIFLSPCEDDDGLVKALSLALERRGWTVWPGASGLFVEASVSAIESELQASTCVILPWTPLNRASTWASLAALSAAEDHKLLQILPSDTAPPSQLQSSPSFSWPDDLHTIESSWSDWTSFLGHVRGLAGEPSGATIGATSSETSQSPQPAPVQDAQVADLSVVSLTEAEETSTSENLPAVIPLVRPQRTDQIQQRQEYVHRRSTQAEPARKTVSFKTMLTLGIAALAGCLLLSAGFALLLFQDDRAASNDYTLGRLVENRSPRSLNAETSWDNIRKDDPVALRSFTEEYSDTPWANDAQAAYSVLEATRWSNLGLNRGAYRKLDAISKFRTDFPTSARIDATSQMETETREQIELAQSQLEALNLLDPDTRPHTRVSVTNAINRFETLTETVERGLIDDTLLDLLQKTAEAGTIFSPEPETDTSADESGDQADSDENETPSSRSQSAAAYSTTPPKSGVSSSPRSVTRPASTGTVIRTFRDCPTCPEMIRLPGGSFIMGSNETYEDVNTRPAHTKIVRPFAIAKHEVTITQWDACFESKFCKKRINDKAWGRGARPAIFISWRDAQDFARWMSNKTGKTYRLPTEAEWEYAARGGRSSRFSFGSSPRQICNYGNSADQTYTKNYDPTSSCSDGVGNLTARVGSFRPNAFGLYDVYGNVWEWVEDCWHPSFEGAPLYSDEAWTADCTTGRRVLRGGAYDTPASELSSARRNSDTETRTRDNIGLRLARDVP